MTERRFLTTDEIADLLRVPVPTVRTWRSRGGGPPGFRAGRHVLYDLEDVEAWIAEQKNSEGDPGAA